MYVYPQTLTVAALTWLHLSLDSNTGLVSNFELLEFLRKKHTVVTEGRKVVPLIEAQVCFTTKIPNWHDHLLLALLSLIFKVIGYLESNPVAKVTKQGAVECLERLEKYNITKAESLQILNLVPTTEVEIHLVITLLNFLLSLRRNSRFS